MNIASLGRAEIQWKQCRNWKYYRTNPNIREWLDVDSSQAESISHTEETPMDYRKILTRDIYSR